MPNQIPLTPTATVIMLPQDAKDVNCFQLDGNTIFSYSYGDYFIKNCKQIAIEGNYTLYQNAFDVSDDVCEMIVDKIWMHSYNLNYYKNYSGGLHFQTKKESYHSLLKSKGVEKDERYCLIIKGIKN